MVKGRWTTEGVDAWSRRRFGGQTLPLWVAAGIPAGLLAAGTVVVGSGNPSLLRGLNIWSVVGVYPLICMSVAGRRISLRFVPALGPAVELADAMEKPVSEHKVWWRESRLLIGLTVLGLLGATASAVAYAMTDVREMPRFGWWLMIASAFAWLGAFLTLRFVRDRRAIAFAREMWTDAGAAADESVVSVRARLEAERAAERAHAEEIARREAALVAGGVGDQIRALERALLTSANLDNDRRVRGLQTQLAALKADLARRDAHAGTLEAERQSLMAQAEETERSAAGHPVTVEMYMATSERERALAADADRRAAVRDGVYFVAGVALTELIRLLS